MEKIELIIDIGSSKIKIYRKNQGVVLNQTAVCLLRTNKNKMSILMSGDEVFSEDILVDAKKDSIIYPIVSGIVVHKKAFYLMMKEFFSRIIPKKLIKPRISALIAITSGMNNIEKKAIEDVFLELGITENIFIESPICSSKSYEVEPILLLDIGHSKTEIALVSNSSILLGATLDVAGNRFSEDILRYIEKKYKILVSKNVAEQAKIAIASLYDHDSSNVLISGISTITNVKTELKLTAQDVKEAIIESINVLCETIEKMTLMIPGSIANEIYENGILLVGGSSKIKGMKDFIQRRIKLKVNTLFNVDIATIEGGNKILSNKEIVSKILSLEKF